MLRSDAIHALLIFGLTFVVEDVAVLGSGTAGSEQHGVAALGGRKQLCGNLVWRPGAVLSGIPVRPATV